jgi:cytidylate kinase
MPFKMKRDIQITISGMPGSGKSTIARHLARKFRLKYYSVGGFMRQIAKKQKISLLELSRKAEKGFEIDRQLDNMTKNLRKKRGFVLDSRLGWHFLPKSIKIFVEVDIKKAADRIFKARRKIERENLTCRKTLANIERRMKSERMRYKKYYGIDIEGLSNYDIMIDTSNLSIVEMNNISERVVAHFSRNFM